MIKLVVNRQQDCFWYLQTLLTPERIYIEIPVLIAHLYRPFRVPSGQIDVLYAYKGL
jgi:hypothetical protein